MSVERFAGEIEVICDDCGESYGTHGAGDFTDMMADAKQDGWRTFKRDGKWHNACPACVRLWIDDMKQQDFFDR